HRENDHLRCGLRTLSNQPPTHPRSTPFGFSPSSTLIVQNARAYMHTHTCRRKWNPCTIPTSHLCSSSHILGAQLLQPRGTLEQATIHGSGNRQRTAHDGAKTGQKAKKRLGRLLAV